MNQKALIAIVVVLFAAFLLNKYVSDDLTPLQRSVANELPNYGYRDVDVTKISIARLEEINVLLRSGKGSGEITGGVKAILERP